jgi:hypothetical protein
VDKSLLEVAQEIVKVLHEAGIVDEQTMRQLETDCLPS